ncbi:2-octaprenyl-6-methoxyphenyl hydroxylase [Carnimonas nigrificans]|uniref:2-octaprenyl-6-methoxyphenyl hydroxylase n=1 Tax=Carnimonas nigrificans TaxID=64323 RepID=UPI000470BD9E|nr:2-octaprenyl-6-methoxyphenyl hydroxylase [Carnimonas nigrificans]
MERFDIAIVGGGLVGASLAASLAELTEQHHLRVVVIEAAAISLEKRTWQPSFDQRSSALAYGTRLHFERMGLWHHDDEQPGLAGEACPIHQVHIAERGRFGAARLNDRDMGTDALGYVVPNAWMGQVLMQRMATLPLEWRCPARVEQVVPMEGGYQLTLDNGDTLQAGLTVLADGGRSPLKAMLGIDSAVHDYQQRALISTLEISRPHRGVAYERFDALGPMALLPLNEQRMALVWTRSPERLAELEALSDAQLLEEIQRFFGDRLGRFTRIGTRSTYPLQLVQAREQVRPHLAVLGNAAHSMHPVAGQGFNLALRGVTDLRDALAQALSQGKEVGDATVMHDFERRRARDRDVMVKASHGLVELFGIDNPLLSHARAVGLIGLNLLGPIRRGLTRRAMGIER